MARKREAISVAATIAVTTEPPEPSTASVANCAAPENTITDITAGATVPQPAVTADEPERRADQRRRDDERQSRPDAGGVSVLGLFLQAREPRTRRAATARRGPS